MSGLNKYEEKERRKIRRKNHEEKDLRSSGKNFKRRGDPGAWRYDDYLEGKYDE